MKRIALLLVCTAALLVPAAALAADGKGGGAGFEQHLARATATVTKVDQKCSVATAPARCAAVKARLSERLEKWQTRLQARIDKLSARPDSEKKTARLAELNDRLAQVQALAAKL
jgi:uncharacterized protein YlxW (UPF0749 family)